MAVLEQVLYVHVFMCQSAQDVPHATLRSRAELQRVQGSVEGSGFFKELSNPHSEHWGGGGGKW